MVSPGPSVRRIRGKQKGKRKLHTPQDIREGVTNAYYIVKEVRTDHQSIYIYNKTHGAFFCLVFAGCWRNGAHNR